jgi:sugar lactone lactonase YvrE
MIDEKLRPGKRWTLAPGLALNLHPARRMRITIPCTSLLALAACGADPDPVQRQPIQIGLAGAAPTATGLAGTAVDPDGAHLWFLAEGDGLVQTDRQGNVTARHRFGEGGLDNLGFTDLAVRPDGKFVLATLAETLLWDPSTGQLESYFCLVPGFELEYSENKAVSLDPAGNRVFAAPVRYEGGGEQPTLLRNEHSQYALTDGTFLRGVDVMTTGVIADGLALLPDGRSLLAVQGSRLYRFDLQGNLQEEWELEGISAATGLGFDAAENRLWVSEQMIARGLPLESLR